MDREDLGPARPGRTVTDGAGSWANWDDGRSTYTLQWDTAAGHPAWQVADWSDTAIEVVEAVRTRKGKRRMADPEFVRHAMGDLRKLQAALDAMQDELLRAARRTGPGTDSALLSWAEIADELGRTRGTVTDRHKRLTAAGETADYAEWLTGRTRPAKDQRPQ